MKYMFLFLMLVVLAGCHNDKPDPPAEVVVVDKSVAYECGTPPAADPYKAKPVKFGVRELDGQKVFTLTGPMYEALMQNLSAVAKGTAQVVGQRDFYKACVDRSQERTAPAPAPTVTTRSKPG